ncbi:alpha/beta-hydrolase [Ceraceosorus guamensis]|uniref:Alpha/beta-hydrolase n=1 Tax=Ceraceosorus guamensis TaxID=1522189 RepID=A0A316W8V7_9BASI|nr:alpha/beta-hydrolase [Ceraceosorus guamensis]PWN46262.1 alpha/beta-hydrolase [Ceraceosorus guamensis]
MIDHLLGRPSTRLKRLQVLLVIAFWSWVLKAGGRDGPKRVPGTLWLSKWGRRWSPWQIIVATLTSVYAIRHLDALFGFGAPEPLARMYSRSFYRVTWIVTALDAGFATAMTIKPVWLRDIASILFSLYYIVYANEADEKLRKFRAFCTIEMIRATWHKTTNPYIRAFTVVHRPSLGIARPLLLPRPALGAHAKRPTRAWLFYAGTEKELREEEELLLDFPGGGFVCMDPRHHEERLRQMAKEGQRPVLSVDYCKAPEFPFPYALEECYDLYRTLHESGGSVIGMSGASQFRIVLTGDSAGANLAVATLFKVLEYPQPHIQSAFATKAAGGPGSKPPALPKPLAMVLAYPSLNFGFSSWMKPDHIRVLRQQSEVNLESIAGDSVHAVKSKGSPLNPARSRSRSRRGSQSSTSVRRPSSNMHLDEAKGRHENAGSRKGGKGKEKPSVPSRYESLASQAELHLAERASFTAAEPQSDDGDMSPHQPGGTVSGDWDKDLWMRRHPSDLEADAAAEAERAAIVAAEEQQRILEAAASKADQEMSDRQKTSRVNTRLTMSSMAGYFQDRILTQSMMRAMAILYVGPRRQPDFDHDYFLSPIVAPARLLAEFPPCLFVCGEKDPICDDTVVMAGRIREAKLAKQAELKRRRAGASARFGEQLRMSLGGSSHVQHDPIEDETVEDWVQMRIIEGYSHGFLQMSSLLPEAKQIITFIGLWITESFDDRNDELDAIAAKQQVSATQSAHGEHGLQAVSSAAKTIPLQLSASAAQGDDDDDDEPLSFTPRSMRSPTTSTAELPPTSPSQTSAPTLVARGQPSPSATGASEKLRPPAVAALARNHRPSSFSGTNTADRPKQVSDLAAAQAEEADSPASRRRLSDSSSSLVASRRAAREAAGTALGSRRYSKEPNGAGGGPSSALLDEKYQAMLVKESSLLQRRREDALASMTQGDAAIENSAVISSDEESEEDEQEASRGRT